MKYPRPTPLPTFSKKERARLRQLAEQAWETELDAELKKLEADFRRWRSKEINAFELSDRIHAFHSGENRDLCLRYTQLPSDTTVPRALAVGLLPKENIDAALLEKLQALIDFFQEREDTEGTGMPPTASRRARRIGLSAESA